MEITWGAASCPGVALTTEAHLGAIINSGRNFDVNTALKLLPAAAPALGTGFGDNATLTVALGAGGNIGEMTKDTLLDSSYLPAAIAVGASARLAA